MHKELMMYDNILSTIEKNTDTITQAILKEIRTRPEARHYTLVSNEIVSARISLVIRDVQKRLGKWLNKHEPRNLSLAAYMDLGAARCRQCEPLEGITAVFLMLRKAIRKVIGMQAAADLALPPDLPEKIHYYVDLLFAGIIQSIITGYRNELDSLIEQGQLSPSCPVQVLMQHCSKSMHANRAFADEAP